MRMLRVRDREPPSQSLVHFDHEDHLDCLQSTGHFIWLHFLFRASSGHPYPNSLFFTTIARVNVCMPPHAYGSLLSGHLSSHGTEQSPGIHADTPQSTIFSGGETLLNFITLARALMNAHMSWNMIHSTFFLHNFIPCLYSFSSSVNSCCCAANSSWAEAMFAMASLSSRMNFAFALRITSSCELRFCFSPLNWKSFLSIVAWSSSTRSLNLPHMRDMLSWRRPQSTGPPLHENWPPVTSFWTLTLGTGGVGRPAVVVAVGFAGASSLSPCAAFSAVADITPRELSASCRLVFCSGPLSVSSSSSLSSSPSDFFTRWRRPAAFLACTASTCSRISRIAARALGVIWRSTSASSFLSPKWSSRPSWVSQSVAPESLSSWAKAAPFLHFTSFSMNENTARSFERIVISILFSSQIFV